MILKKVVCLFGEQVWKIRESEGKRERERDSKKVVRTLYLSKLYCYHCVSMYVCTHMLEPRFVHLNPGLFFLVSSKAFLLFTRRY